MHYRTKWGDLLHHIGIRAVGSACWWSLSDGNKLWLSRMWLTLRVQRMVMRWNLHAGNLHHMAAYEDEEEEAEKDMKLFSKRSCALVGEMVKDRPRFTSLSILGTERALRPHRNPHFPLAPYPRYRGPWDDVCGTCHQGGKLLCCECCPRTSHVSCAGLTAVPSREVPWLCATCSAAPPKYLRKAIRLFLGCWQQHVEEVRMPLIVARACALRSSFLPAGGLARLCVLLDDDMFRRVVEFV